jgi:hypothetical protein
MSSEISALGVLAGLWSFVAPSVAWWFFVARLRTDDAFDSFVAVAALSCVLIPTGVFVLNRLSGYPITGIGTTTLATVMVVLAPLWPRYVSRPLTRLSRWLRQWIRQG